MEGAAPTLEGDAIALKTMPPPTPAREGGDVEPAASADSGDLLANVVRRVEQIRKAVEKLPPLPAAPKGRSERMALWWKLRLPDVLQIYHAQTRINDTLFAAVRDLVELHRASLAVAEEKQTGLRSELQELRKKAEPMAAMQQRLEELSAEADSFRQAIEELRSQIARAADEARQVQNEERERVQQLQDEQRVCFKQLSLANSEEMALADRARRAVELQLEELAKRVDELSGRTTK